MSKNSNYPRTCTKCNHRIDSPNAAFKNWEEARRPLEQQIKVNTNKTKLMLQIATKTIEALIDQQAYPDEFYTCNLSLLKEYLLELEKNKI
jgi:hypothetical protein